jgi:hypothetical protein|tara:strand:- start:144 stop:653 length:510 start_codon:yes stop_codon:yes gene_type:complete
MRFSEWEKNVAPKLMGPTVAAGNNKDAFTYLVQQAYCVRIIDNLYDQDYPPTNEELMDVSKLLFSVIPSNPFYQEHIKTLQPVASMAWEAWEQSNELCKMTCTDRIYAHVFRDQINYMNELVALLTQGYEKMVEVRKELEHSFSDSWMKSLEGTNVKLEYTPYGDNIQS